MRFAISAEQLVFQSEKALSELGDKLSADEKSRRSGRDRKGEGSAEGHRHRSAIKAATDGLSQDVLRSGRQALSAGQAPQGDPDMGGQPGAGAQGGQQGDFVDADFTEVKDDDNK